MSDLPGAFQEAARAKAISEVGDFVLSMPERRAAREAAKQRQKMGELQLQQMQMQLEKQKALQDPTIDATQAQLKQQELQMKKTMAELAKNTAYSAFQRYEADGSVKHLNLLLQDLQKNPVGSRLMPEVVRFDQFTEPTEQDKQLLKSVGIENVDEFYNHPELRKRFVKATLVNGQTEIRDMNQIYIGSGYAKYMSDQELERMVKQAELVAKLQKKESSGTQIEREARMIAEREGIPYLEALQKARLRAQSFGSAPERQAARDPSVRQEVVTASEELKVPEQERRQRIVDAAKKQLDQAFGGNFLQAKLDNLAKEQREVLDKSLRRIEKVGDLSLSEGDKSAFRDIAQLVAIAKPGSAVSGREAGILDSIFDNVKKYVTDNAGSEAVSAYAAFRNSVRNALFGSALTDAEIESFNEAFGTLKQQARPVLVQFKTALLQVKGKLEAIANLNDQYVVKARLGMTQDQLDDVIFALEERIEAFDRIAPAVEIGGSSAPKPAPKSGSKPPLDEFFK